MAVIVEHIVGEMSDEGVQRCVICGLIVCDYRNAMVCVEDGPLPSKGWVPGTLYISGKNPTVFFTTLSEGEEAIKCQQ